MKINIQKHYDIQHLVSRIVSSDFDKNDIKMLFIEIRECLLPNSYPYIKDLCDLVAHNVRNKGYIYEILEHFDLFLKFDSDIRKEKLRLDRIPQYVQKYLYLQLNSIDNNRMMEDLGRSNQTIKKQLEKHIKKCDNKSSVFYVPTDSPSSVRENIEYLLKKFELRQAYKQDGLIDELLTFLFKHKFISSKIELSKELGKITLCILLIIHDSTYNVKSAIHKIESSICYIQSYYNRQDNMFYLGNFLHIHYSELNNKKVNLIIPIMRTNLKSAEWCDISLATIATSGIKGTCKYPDYKTCQALKLNSNFKLYAANSDIQYNDKLHENILFVDSFIGNDIYGDGSLGYEVKQL